MGKPQHRQATVRGYFLWPANLLFYLPLEEGEVVVTGAAAANQSRSQVQHFLPAPVRARGAAAFEGLSCGRDCVGWP